MNDEILAHVKMSYTPEELVGVKKKVAKINNNFAEMKKDIYNYCLSICVLSYIEMANLEASLDLLILKNNSKLIQEQIQYIVRNKFLSEFTVQSHVEYIHGKINLLIEQLIIRNKLAGIICVIYPMPMITSSNSYRIKI
jgi:hypothetical protein